MAQNREIGELGQIVTVDTSANSLTVNGSVIVGNSSINAVTNSSTIALNGTVVVNNTTFVFGSKGVSANGSLGLDSQVLTTNGSAAYWSSAGVNTNATYVWSNAHTFNGVVTFAQTAVGTVNNALYLNGTNLSTLQGQITSNASAAYTNAVSYTDGKILTANSAITGNAATAYTNSVSYTDSKILTANSAITGNAATAYTNAVSYTDGKIATANTAMAANAATAYTNATIFASNASNINSGTLAEARLPYRMNQNVRNSDTVEFAGMTLTGNLVVSGNVNIIGANNLSISDNMIYLNSNNDVSNPDLGIAANYNDGTYAHTGIFRDASDGIWKIFDSYTPEPDANVYIDTTNTSFHLANFQANTIYGGNTSTNWFISNTGGTYLTGTINAASHTVGTSTIANSTGVYTGIVNATTVSTGSVNVVNSSGLTTTANVNIGAAGELILTAGAGIYANGALGTAGHVLHSNGTSVYWAADDNSGGTVTSVGTGNGLTGGSITTTGTVSVLANNGITANSTGLFVTQGTGTVVNATGVHVNATYIGTLSANNASFLGGTAAASYQLNSTLNANIASYLPTYTGVVNGSSHTVGSSLIANATGVYHTGTVNAATIQVGTSVVANSSRLVIGTAVGLQANGGIGTSGQVLTSNATSVYWASPAASGVTSVATGNGVTGGTITTTGTISVVAGTGAVVNATGVHVNSTYIGTLTANNATFAFGLSAASTTATGSTVVTRDANGDFNGRYINASYHNSTDDISAGTISHIMAKFGDNYHRSATAAKVATFISGQSMNISGSATSATTATTATNLSGGSVAATSITASSDLTLTTVPFFLNAKTVASNYTISGSYNALSTGPITINNSVTVTISTGATWVVL
jgi:hypothetical protein